MPEGMSSSKFRFHRLFGADGKCFDVAIDHGFFNEFGFLSGIENLNQAVRTVVPPLLNDFIALMKDTSLVGVLGAVEVVKAGQDVQTEFFNGSALILGALMFLVVTIPLARIVDRMIAKQQARTSRTGGSATAEPAPAGAAGMGQTGGPV